jgi:hypothetical protein
MFQANRRWLWFAALRLAFQRISLMRQAPVATQMHVLVLLMFLTASVMELSLS